MFFYFPRYYPWFSCGVGESNRTLLKIEKVERDGKTSTPPELRRRRLFAHVSQGRHPIIPILQHSTIPAAERSGAKFFTFVSEANKTGANHGPETFRPYLAFDVFNRLGRRQKEQQ